MKNLSKLYCVKYSCVNYAPNSGRSAWDNGKQCKIGKCPKKAKCPGYVGKN